KPSREIGNGRREILDHIDKVRMDNKGSISASSAVILDSLQMKLTETSHELLSTLLMADTTHISKDEAALYDRQIRLWGLEAQQRMRISSILISGMRGLSNEICKNLVLAGIGSITIIDHNVVTEEDLGTQFFVTEADIGKNKAIVSVDRIRQLNPRVVVTADNNDIRAKSDDFFKTFDLVCLTDCDPYTMIRINEICRIFDKKFYAACTYGFYGYIFCDLKQHEYIVERKVAIPHKDEHEITKIKKNDEYVSFQCALSKADWTEISDRKLKKISPLLWAIQILWKFQQEMGRLPATNDNSDVEKLLSLRNSYLQTIHINNLFVTDEFLITLASFALTELTPICAILGGVLAQDILNVLSKKGAPINNLFVFDGLQ
ncbi:5517_t:CDS:10, partial [Dentiscutata heterogama]